MHLKNKLENARFQGLAAAKLAFVGAFIGGMINKRFAKIGAGIGAVVGVTFADTYLSTKNQLHEVRHDHSDDQQA